MPYDPSLQNFFERLLQGSGQGVDVLQQNQAQKPQLFLTIQKMLADQQQETYIRLLNQHKLEEDVRSNRATEGRLKQADLEKGANDRALRAQGDVRNTLTANRNAVLERISQGNLDVAKTNVDLKKQRQDLLDALTGAQTDLTKAKTGKVTGTGPSNAELGQKRQALQAILADIRQPTNYQYKPEADYKKLTPPEQGQWEPVYDKDGITVLNYRRLKPNLQALHDRTSTELQDIGGLIQNRLMEELKNPAGGTGQTAFDEDNADAYFQSLYDQAGQ